MAPTSKQNTFALASVGIDIGKEVFHLVGFDTDGKIVLRRKIKRLTLVSDFEKLAPCIVGMEACLSAHFVSRTLRKLGHEPRIIPAIYLKPFVRGRRKITTMPRQLPTILPSPNTLCSQATVNPKWRQCCSRISKGSRRFLKKCPPRSLLRP